MSLFENMVDPTDMLWLNPAGQLTQWDGRENWKMLELLGSVKDSLVGKKGKEKEKKNGSREKEQKIINKKELKNKMMYSAITVQLPTDQHPASLWEIAALLINSSQFLLLLSTVQQKWEHHCVINIILMQNPKYVTIPAAKKKINSIPA